MLNKSSTKSIKRHLTKNNLKVYSRKLTLKPQLSWSENKNEFGRKPIVLKRDDMMFWYKTEMCANL
jgi:hypothetical protein